ncbi:DUF1016 N-terminal domain-containing protein [Rubritalea tangerina]|uniref:DUF1016 N-terminal domain-containing protein n=1 Tax=Rubritalea tangerina TaxID=430798 RepID=UPI0036111FCE
MSQSPDNTFFTEIRQILAKARTQVAQTVNTAMVEAYWQIGKRIVEEEQGGDSKAKYGTQLLQNLSTHLTEEFGKGFSLANLKNMRQFYRSCPEKGIRYTLSSELSWSHNCVIMREENESAREYYLTQSKQHNWSVRELKRQLETQTTNAYFLQKAQKLILKKVNLPLKNQHATFSRSYVLEFLTFQKTLAYRKKS